MEAASKTRRPLESRSKSPGTVACVDVRSHTSRRSNPLPIFHPEFGRFMLEATPGKPWGISPKELLEVEPDMKLR